MPDRNVGKIVGIAAAIVGGMSLVICCGCGGLFYWLTWTPSASGPAALEPFDLTSVPIPPMPDRAAVELETIDLGMLFGKYRFAGGDGPGQSGELYFYIPAGEHPSGSLPCVLIGPAGTTLMEGMELGEGDMEEHVPYVRYGFVVVAYSLDGAAPLDANGEPVEFDPTAYRGFHDSMAGVVNARNAMEFVLAEIPEVDPKRIYAVGHSSAGTLSLLFAEHEPRLAGAVAFMPVYDVPARFGSRLRGIEMGLPGATDFAYRSSPKTHADRLNCRVFLYAAEDDGNVPAGDVRAAAADLQARGKTVTIDVAPFGGHRYPMIDSGIPKAIAWLQRDLQGTTATP